ncbi:hypothetical protein POM88_013608 [Heracleum sosnowskyi]|uniref:Uncharacterized protein n=1 Tax=Heracleum sosnowskyi TaxID=360622 RepID=A0AAD8IYT0_9APIA|nr:hypothetical protein POM88_013608 [Heracleum sosnowskyi]
MLDYDARKFIMHDFGDFCLSISEETQIFYFAEFKKYFAWKQSDAVIYKGWLTNARRKYSEFVSVARSNWERYNRRDNRISLNVYLSWVEFWRTENFQKKSSIQKSNRRSGVDGRPSTHTSGSASHRTVAARAKVQKVHYKREPTADLIFYLTHTKRVKTKKNPIAEAIENGMNDEDVEVAEDAEDDGNVEVVWIDKKSQKIYHTRRRGWPALVVTEEVLVRRRISCQKRKTAGSHYKKKGKRGRWQKGEARRPSVFSHDTLTEFLQKRAFYERKR